MAETADTDVEERLRKGAVEPCDGCCYGNLMIEASTEITSLRAHSWTDRRKTMTLRAITLLNEEGDTTITWTEDRDDIMEQVIQKKMDAGCTFFIIEPRFGARQPLKRAGDARKYRHLAIPDDALTMFVSDGSIDVVKTPNEAARVKGKAKTAKEVAASESIGLTPRRGG